MKFARRGLLTKRDDSMSLLKKNPTQLEAVTKEVVLPKLSTSYRYVRVPVRTNTKALQQAMKQLFKMNLINTTISGRKFMETPPKKSKGRPVGVVLALIDHDTLSIRLGWSLCNETASDVFDKAHGRHLALGVAQGNLVNNPFQEIPTMYDTGDELYPVGYTQLRKFFLDASKLELIPNSIVSACTAETLALLKKYPNYRMSIATIPPKKKRVHALKPSPKERAELRANKLRAQLNATR